MLGSSASPRGLANGRVRVAAALSLVCALLLVLAGCDLGGTPSPGGTSMARGPNVWQPPANPPQQEQTPAGDWPRFGFDPARSGVNLSETTLTASNVAGLHRLWQVHLPNTADSSPALLQGVRLPDGSTRAVLYLTTLDGHILALDAATGALLWSQQPSGPKITNSSPVVDPTTATVYAYGLDGALHGYAAATGQERTGKGWPAPVTRMTQSEKESSSLNLAQGHVYVATSGYIGDAPPYQGHVVAVATGDGSEHVFNSLCAGKTILLTTSECSAEQSGIWARAGVVVDPVTGNLFVATGNGPFDPGAGNYGDSVLELSPDSSRLLDSYTPTTQQQLNDTDADLGSTAPAMLPKVAGSAVPYLALQGGKDNLLRLLDRQNLSGAGRPGGLGGEMQVISSPVCSVFTQPVVTTHAGADWVFVAGTCGLAAFTIALDAHHQPGLRMMWKSGDVVTTPVLAGGVLYAAMSGQVNAYDPWSGRQLWNSAQASAGGSIGDIHWESPIVAGGVLYIPDQSGNVTAYGLGQG